jgi:hypothetical protein
MAEYGCSGVVDVDSRALDNGRDLGVNNLWTAYHSSKPGYVCDLEGAGDVKMQSTTGNSMYAISVREPNFAHSAPSKTGNPGNHTKNAVQRTILPRN